MWKLPYKKGSIAVEVADNKLSVVVNSIDHAAVGIAVAKVMTESMSMVELVVIVIIKLADNDDDAGDSSYTAPCNIPTA